MSTKDYYRHMRSLAPFRAVDCLRAARQAAALDQASAMAKQNISFVDVSTIHEYGLTQKLSNSVRCF
jgi:hypothetical protein